MALSKKKAVPPHPTPDQVLFYLKKWDALENYHLQENALNKLFWEMCPSNTAIEDVLLKASTLNDFYSTNIFSIFPVAKHILSIPNIDQRIADGDLSLIADIQKVEIGGVTKNFYSFSTKFCSHHNPDAFPIYDSYIDEVLRHFRSRDKFASFYNADLKDYSKFVTILRCFTKYYDLQGFTVKQIDQYLWQLGKEYFPKNYNKASKD